MSVSSKMPLRVSHRSMGRGRVARTRALGDSPDYRVRKTLPIFPLSVVALPAATVPLMIFEARQGWFVWHSLIRGHAPIAPHIVIDKPLHFSQIPSPLQYAAERHGWVRYWSCQTSHHVSPTNPPRYHHYVTLLGHYWFRNWVHKERKTMGRSRRKDAS